MSSYKWHPITDLSEEEIQYKNSDLQVLAQSWRERLIQLRNSQKLKEFNEHLARQWAVETGIIERVYTLDRGVTQMLIEQGFDASFISHGKSNKPAPLVVSIIKDQKEVIEGLFDFVSQRRSLNTSYIKQMHQVFMRNQRTTEAVDKFGNYIQIEIIRGEWKKWPNNPKRDDGSIHEYCPPEQVASEIDRLIALHYEHIRWKISPEIEAAWLHHRFTQIHPFQDGNGRIARALASLIFLRSGWFPLVIVGDKRKEYISASEQADQDDLIPMIDLFASRQIQAFRRALSISEDVTPQQSIQTIIQKSLERLRQRPTPNKVFDLSSVLEAYTTQRLRDVAHDLSTAIQDLNPNYWSSVTNSEPETNYWFRSEIVDIAKKFEYYANFRFYRSWVNMKIKEDRLANLIYSFHGLGYEFTGIMAVSAFLDFRTDEDVVEGSYDGPYAMCSNIFQFSFEDEEDQLIERYKDWLEETILIGLEQWRKQL